MAVSTLVRLSEDKVTRHVYQKRQDEIVLHNRNMTAWQEDKRIMDEQAQEIARLRKENESLRAGITN